MNNRTRCTSICIFIIIISLNIAGCTNCNNNAVRTSNTITISDYKDKDLHTNVNREEFEPVALSILYGLYDNFDPNMLNKKVATQGFIGSIALDKNGDTRFQFVDDFSYVDCIWFDTDPIKTAEVLKYLVRISEKRKQIKAYGEYVRDPRAIRGLRFVIYDIDIDSIQPSESLNPQHTPRNALYTNNDENDFHNNVNREEFLPVKISDLANINIGEKIVLRGKVNKEFSFLRDTYRNIRFMIEDNSGSIQCFWYNTYLPYTGHIFEELVKAEKESKDILVYGTYEKDPNRLDHFNIFVYDIEIIEAQSVESNDTSNSNAEEAEKLLVVTKDNIAQFKPVVHLHKVYYDEEKTSFRGHRISWDSVEGADYVIVFSGRPGDYTTGKIVEPDSDSGIILNRAFEKFIVVYKDGISSLPSEVISINME